MALAGDKQCRLAFVHICAPILNLFAGQRDWMVTSYILYQLSFFVVVSYLRHIKYKMSVSSRCHKSLMFHCHLPVTKMQSQRRRLSKYLVWDVIFAENLWIDLFAKFILQMSIVKYKMSQICKLFSSQYSKSLSWHVFDFSPLSSVVFLSPDLKLLWVLLSLHHIPML